MTDGRGQANFGLWFLERGIQWTTNKGLSSMMSWLIASVSTILFSNVRHRSRLIHQTREAYRDWDEETVCGLNHHVDGGAQ